MICHSLREFNPSCETNIAAGIRDVYIFDPADFNFTTTVGAPLTMTYTAMTAVTGDGVPDPFDPKIYRVKFKRGGSAQLVQTQSIAENGGNVWDYVLSGNLVPVLTTATSQFIHELQVASVCCGLGFIITLNNGQSLIIGEQNVNAEPVADWSLMQNGTVINTGVLIGDVFGGALNFTAQYNRNAYHIEYATYSGFIYDADDV